MPSIGCRCEVCNSTNPKNKRTRASIYIETETTSLIVDTGPDLRVQALQNNITKVDGVFYTHSHADHINGIDDMKSFNFLAQKPLPAFGDKFTMDYIRKAFPYVFTENAQGNWYKPWLVAKEIGFYDEFQFGDINIKTFEQIHGKMSVVGYRFNDIAYSTDTNFISQKGLDIIKGVKLWIVDCIKYEESETHANFDRAMKWIDIVKPEKAILTHMAHDIEYEKVKGQLPKTISPAFDSMSIIV